MEVKHISDSEDALEVFDKRCADMLSGKFIVADAKIRGVLKSIAASRRLLSVFAHAAKSFDFDLEFDKAIAITEDGKKRVRIPEDPERYAAFVYSLFLEIDMKNIDLHKLLNEYYAIGQDVYDYYNYFKASVVSTFKVYVGLLFFDEQIPSIFPTEQL